MGARPARGVGRGGCMRAERVRLAVPRRALRRSRASASRISRALPPPVGRRRSLPDRHGLARDGDSTAPQGRRRFDRPVEAARERSRRRLVRARRDRHRDRPGDRAQYLALHDLQRRPRRRVRPAQRRLRASGATPDVVLPRPPDGGPDVAPRERHRGGAHDARPGDPEPAQHAHLLPLGGLDHGLDRPPAHGRSTAAVPVHAARREALQPPTDGGHPPRAGGARGDEQRDPGEHERHRGGQGVCARRPVDRAVFRAQHLVPQVEPGTRACAGGARPGVPLGQRPRHPCRALARGLARGGRPSRHRRPGRVHRLPAPPCLADDGARLDALDRPARPGLAATARRDPRHVARDR